MADNSQGIEEIAKKLSNLSKLAIEEYEPLVNKIIISKVKDERHIEKILDGLLDFCFDEEILYLYKKLCRYYYELNPHATVDYINYYRKQYETEIEDK
ncbi:hypothetical protein CRV03_02640 [Arcobacter sp. F155]|uniref:hypothetical protein n=1 Tax=Arcobacter sp. F155 TaxID=2044512 RepID=UPI00100A4A96|nr:hypothetical protein [Arcobacter sp. F155]RXJ77886.1 hypothetical protein CRV03_02640 [Arcobacter sp. F155]